MPIHGYPGGVISSTAPTIAPTGASGVWTTETQLQNSANWPSADYITRSLRFDSADTTYLSRTPASAGNRKTWTWSGWVKRSELGSGVTVALFSTATAINDSSFAVFMFSVDDLRFSAASTLYLSTTQLFRDTSAWYHIVLAVDTTQATANNRIRMYVNGSEITSFASRSNPSLNADLALNNNTLQTIGITNEVGTLNRKFNGYLADITFVDGLALTPSSFGAADPNTGEWQPQVYHGTYGTNGFFLRFANNTGTTSTTLGLDSSGNGNNWTPSGFSITAGAGNDSLVDSPSSYGTDTGVGGQVRGNYATLNVLNTNGSNTFSNGNLDVTVAAGSTSVAIGTIGVTSGQWYWEVTFTGGANAMIGISDVSAAITSQNWTTVNTWSYYSSNGDKYNNSTATGYGSSYTTNDVIGIALNMDAGTLVFYKNGVSQGTAFSTGIAGKTIVPNLGNGAGGTTQSYVCNFGQRPFAYTAPAGFKCLVDTNLPTPTIGATNATQAGKYFNTVLYTGTGSSLSVTGVGFQPDWTWIKSRSAATDHGLYDAVRGVQKQLESNNTDAETTETTGLTAFNSDGFTVGALAQLNTNTATYVGWNWKANGAGSSNTAGSITSTVSVNTTSGFSIVTYTGNATAGATVGHGLNVAPKFVILKSRSVATSWYVWSTGLTSAEYEIYLNLTDAEGNPAFTFLYDAAPTATTFSLPTAGYGSNNSGATYVAYCFAPIAGYSAFGKYVGTAGTQGPFVYTGFRPKFILVKGITSFGGNQDYSSWFMQDSVRSPYNNMPYTTVLWANRAYAEGVRGNGSASGTYLNFDFYSNGFAPIGGSNVETNASGSTYIYAAFAEFPFKFARAR